MDGGALARRGYVAGNLIAAFVTGADGNFDVVIKFFSFRLSLMAYSVLFYMYFYFQLPFVGFVAKCFMNRHH